MEDAEREWGNDEVLATFFVFFFRTPTTNFSILYVSRASSPMRPPHCGVCEGLRYATGFKQGVVSYRDLGLMVCGYYFILR